MASSPELFDPWTRDYALLGLRLERVVPGTVDAWLGPPEWRERVESEPVPAAEALRQASNDLLDRLPGMGYETNREAYLTRQVTALHTLTRIVDGEDIPFRERATLLFDIHPEPVPESSFAAAHRRMDSLLPGTGSLAERMTAWRRSFDIPKDRLMDALVPVEAEVRRRTRRHLPLPDDESIEITLVEHEPWGAYNWYLGNARSRIDINTDLPLRATALVDYLAHEAYPGHHTEHALREIRQYREAGQSEYAIQLINTPESLISEAIATSAGPLIFENAEELEWLAAEVLPNLGMSIDPAQAAGLREASEGLTGLDGNAALMLHEEGRPVEEVVEYLMHWSLRPRHEVEKGLEFVQSPLWRTYVFTYSYGKQLLKPLLSGEDRFAVFERILTQPVYPSRLAS